jgi:ubiquinone/menaquinone biosynthesis C-methylase UbiE
MMAESNRNADYALGSTDAEHERLIRQAAHLLPLTERLFLEAGIGPGQRVLELGSGVGDVAMLAAKLVGGSGEVVGIERDSRSIARARARVAGAGLSNVSFTQSDANEIPGGRPFDAAVGRFILMFIPKPAGVLQSVARLVRPGGVIAFHEPQWAPFLKILEPLPLSFACASVVRETFLRAGASTELGLRFMKLFWKLACLRRRCEWKR